MVYSGCRWAARTGPTDSSTRSAMKCLTCTAACAGHQVGCHHSGCGGLSHARQGHTGAHGITLCWALMLLAYGCVTMACSAMHLRFQWSGPLAQSQAGCWDWRPPWSATASARTLTSPSQVRTAAELLFSFRAKRLAQWMQPAKVDLATCCLKGCTLPVALHIGYTHMLRYACSGGMATFCWQCLKMRRHNSACAELLACTVSGSVPMCLAPCAAAPPCTA